MSGTRYRDIGLIDARVGLPSVRTRHGSLAGGRDRSSASPRSASHLGRAQ